MNQKSPPLDTASPAASLTGLTGARTIGELITNPDEIDGRKLGKQAIRDIGARYRQIIGLKPGSSSIRTPEMIEEILERLLMGENIASITCADNMPALSTLWYWCRDDVKLDEDIKWATAIGQRLLVDLTQNIALGGEFSTGDVRRDQMLVDAITKTAAKRNRAEFGDKVQVEHSRVVVNMPDWAVSVASSDPLKIEDISDNDR